MNYKFICEDERPTKCAQCGSLSDTKCGRPAVVATWHRMDVNDDPWLCCRAHRATYQNSENQKIDFVPVSKIRKHKGVWQVLWRGRYVDVLERWFQRERRKNPNWAKAMDRLMDAEASGARSGDELSKMEREAEALLVGEIPLTAQTNLP